jgi:hypothetical protein
MGPHCGDKTGGDTNTYTTKKKKTKEEEAENSY